MTLKEDVYRKSSSLGTVVMFIVLVASFYAVLEDPNFFNRTIMMVCAIAFIFVFIKNAVMQNKVDPFEEPEPTGEDRWDIEEYR